MSHNYLFDTYDYIRKRLTEAEGALTASDADEDRRHFAAGQVEMLCAFEHFLTSRYHFKLPRRLQHQPIDAQAVCKRFEPGDD